MKRAALVAVALAVVSSWSLRSAGAQGDPARTAGPRIEIDRAHIGPGQPIVVTLTGWTGRLVTLSVCSNNALRGSTDCNQRGSLGVGLNRDGSPTLTEFVVLLPPGNCPCVIRAASKSNEAVAFAPIEIAGVPVGPLVEPTAAQPVALTVRVERADVGLVGSLRSALGGPMPFDVTVKVRNRSAFAYPKLVVAGSVGRGRTHDTAAITFESPASLAPGGAWTQTVRAVLPAPSVGKFVWSVSASGAGPTVRDEVVVRRLPLLFVIVVVLFVVVVLAIVWRRVRQRAEREPELHDDPAAQPPVVADDAPTGRATAPPPALAPAHASVGDTDGDHSP
jgi:hypothetical protein